MKSAPKTEEIEERIKRYPANKENLIPILQDLQTHFGYLSETAIKSLSKFLKVSESEIFGVATFYAQFKFNPPGEHTIRVCLGTACHIKGGQQLLEEIEQKLRIKCGETTKDGVYDLQRVACVGCCALAPVIIIDGEVVARVSSAKIKKILINSFKGEDVSFG